VVQLPKDNEEPNDPIKITFLNPFSKMDIAEVWHNVEMKI
jgi:hypothetical protein